MTRRRAAPGKLSHVDAEGRARMVDVGPKRVTARHALAEGIIRMGRAAFALVEANRVAKGDVLRVAELAGIGGAKRTAELIPLCHPLALDHVSVTATLDPTLPGVRVRAEARLKGKTGVEMEALTACAVALLAVYDMVKAADRGMTIGELRLLEKSGGRSGRWQRRG
jgi:cyclic pyranopterin phosphate synthase